MSSTGGYFRQTQRKRLVVRPYQNPYFRREPKRNWRRWLFIGIGCVSAGLVFFFLAAPWFEIHAVEIRGTEILVPREIEVRVRDHLNQRRFFSFKNGNQFLFRPQELTKALEKQYVFESLSVMREGGTVRIDIREKQSELVWMTPEKTYIIDREGVVLRTLSQEESGARENGTDPFARLLQCRSMQKQALSVGASVLNPSEVETLFFFRREWEPLGIFIKEIKIDRASGSWMTAKTGLGFEILFDPNGSAKDQTSNLFTVFCDQIKDPGLLEYIDLRFGNHVYYK